MSDQEFKFLGNSIETISIRYGIFLVAWAATISWISQSESATSWIPAILGFPIFISGWLSRIKPARKKLYMHISALFGLLACLGGLGFLIDLISESGPFHNPYAGTSKLILLLSGGLFCFLCVMSFRFARMKKKNDPIL